MISNFMRLVTGAVVAAVCLGSTLGSAIGQARGEFAVFNSYDAESTTNYLFKDWDDFLHAVVFDVGPSHRFRVNNANDKPTGTNLGGGSTRSASWLEGNRIRFHLFTDETSVFLESIKASMVEVAENEGIATWNRNEQLAYWLNLHNLLVMQVTTEAYPYSSAKRLHRKFWKEDLVTVKGVNLSIEDIQNEIILSIWDNPIVIYGLFQGAVGGPSLRPLALRGTTVDLSLQRNGEEFVNSYRGVHGRGKTALASQFYEWTARAFPNFETDLRRHLSGLADDKTVVILEKSRKIKASYIAWGVPDFFSGRLRDVGNASSTSALTALSGSGAADASSSLATQTFIAGRQFLSDPSDVRMPSHTRQLLDALRRKFRIYDMSNRGMTNSDILVGRR